jgi:hypothetical protein
MFNGGKKDASYIANLLDAVTQWLPSMIQLRCWLISSDLMVQGMFRRVLESWHGFTQEAYCFRGGKHDVALFLDDLGRLKSIRVRRILSFIP